MNKDQITKCIEEARTRIQKKILIDNLLIFLSRIHEDLSRNPDAKVFGRCKDLFIAINPYTTYEGNDILKFFRKDFECRHGMELTDQEKHFVQTIFNELSNEYTFSDGKVMKGRIKGMITKLCEKYLPNSMEVIEPIILCKLIAASRGIDRMKNLPSSTIQLLGAEQALFRHKTKGTRSPKYGLLYYSRSIQTEEDKGKAARQRANKLAISIKVDYFQKFNK
jgi:hypothetical protein